MNEATFDKKVGFGEGPCRLLFLVQIYS